MKKLFLLIGFVALTLGFTSCTCECVGPNDNDTSNKVCKTEYENLYGPGTWGSYEANAKNNAGYVCK